MKDFNKTVKTFMIVISILTLAMAIGLTFVVIEVRNATETLTNIELAYGIRSPVTEEEVGFHEVTSTKDLNTILAYIRNGLATYRLRNAYMQIFAAGDTSETLGLIITNEHGEAITQDMNGGINIFLNNGNTVFYGDNVVYGMDLTVIDQISYACDGVLKGYAKLKESGSGNIETGEFYQEYVIDIPGWDNIQKVYSAFSEDYGVDFVNILHQNLASTVTDADISYTTIRYAIILNEKSEVVACSNYYYFGEDNIGAWLDCYSSWGFESYMPIEDWQLPEIWYTYDYSKMGESDGTELANMLTEIQEDIEAKIEYSASLWGYDLITDDSLSGAEPTDEVYSEYPIEIDESRPHVHNEDGTVTYLDEEPTDEEPTDEEPAGDEGVGVESTGEEPVEEESVEEETTKEEPTEEEPTNTGD
jgi:hypothetical protein